MDTAKDYIIERTTLGSAKSALAESLRLALEHASAGQVVTLKVEGDENIFAQLSAQLDGPASVLGTLPGPRYLQDGFKLSSRALVQLARRGWSLAGAADGMEDYYSRDWDGITSEAECRHVAEEVAGVLTGLFCLPPERTATVYVNFDPSALS